MDRRTSRIALLLIVTSAVTLAAMQDATNDSDHTGAGVAWPELRRSMENMHAAMGPIRPSGDNDVDFAGLMLPHHRAAIDMAKAELIYGKDPQMRRLAQEIVIDQQSETELMQLWLKRRAAKTEK